MTAFADGVLALAWAATVLLAWGAPGRRPPWALAAGLVLAVAVGTLALRLEAWTGGRLWSAPATAILGLLLVTAGAILHARARAAMGRAWSPLAAPGDDLVTQGPYARLRHPAYAGLGLMALGSVMVHPSIPAVAAAVGLVGGLLVKSRLEDRRLAERFGARWRRWAAEVPPWWPRRLTRHGTPR